MVDFISSGIRLGQMCDLSRDVVAGLPVISMLGDCEVFIENYRGILEYSSEYLKVSTKIGIIENLLTKVDNLILCGGMTYTFAKAQGGKIGKSICEDDKLDVALDVIK